MMKPFWLKNLYPAVKLNWQSLENTRFHAKPRVSTAGEIRVNHADGFYSYTAKYLGI